MKRPVAALLALLACGAPSAAAAAAALSLGARGRSRVAATPAEEYDGESELHSKLLSCSAYDSEELCTEGDRRMRCEWLKLYKCQERTAPPAPQALSDPECKVLTEMRECMAGIGCVFDSVTGGCHASPPVCDKITCGEERSPPEPLQCFPPLKKVKREGACCFICAEA
mmetsp:Transcript_58352/g.125375  ORF Transcript_58352/g.125375 Transcript_58352/m.125375 type:complete len:169 (+) Transcript_58352:91-597(+)